MDREGLGSEKKCPESYIVLAPEQKRFIELLLSLPMSKRGRHPVRGVSTKVIQWVIAYMIDFQVMNMAGEEADRRDVGRGNKRGRPPSSESFYLLSRYLNFSKSFYGQVKASLKRYEDEIISEMRHGGR